MYKSLGLREVRQGVTRGAESEGREARIGGMKRAVVTGKGTGEGGDEERGLVG